MKKIYSGLLVTISNGEESGILALVNDKFEADEPLAQVIQGDMYYGKYLSVRYYLSEEKLSKKKLQEEFVRSLYGAGDAEYGIKYSEITGYLWTTEEIEVGGHDLLEELKSNLGKWLYMEIEYSKTGK